MNAAPQTPAALTGRVVLVTGAGGGLGGAVAKACAAAGASVIVMGRKPVKLGRLVDAITRTGGDATAIALDLEGAAPDDYLQAISAIEGEFHRLDAIVHCAAHFPGLTPLSNADPASIARALHVNLTARVWLVQAALPLLKKTAGAAVIFAQDDLALTQKAYWGGYGMAHHAQAALVPMLAEETAAAGLRILALEPGPMRTGLRAKAFVEEDDLVARDPAIAAQRCVALIAGNGE